MAIFPASSPDFWGREFTFGMVGSEGSYGGREEEERDEEGGI